MEWLMYFLVVLCFSIICASSEVLHPWLDTDIPVSIPLQILDLLMEEENSKSMQSRDVRASADLSHISDAQSDKNGMHVNLQVSIRVLLDHTQTSDLLVVFKIPRGCYADIDELRNRHSGYNWNNVEIYSPSTSINPELLAEQAHAEVLGIAFLQIPSDSFISAPFRFSIPVHLLYHSARPGGGIANIAIPPPLVYLSHPTLSRPLSDEETSSGSLGCASPKMRCVRIVESDITQSQPPLSSRFRLASPRPPPARAESEDEDKAKSPSDNGGSSSVVLQANVGDLESLGYAQAVTTLVLGISTALLLGTIAIYK